MSTVHISGAGLFVPPAERENEAEAYCCMGAVMHGACGCTCWEPIFDLEQAELDLATEPSQRDKCCGDCAYRNGSPEREDDYEEEHLFQIAGCATQGFWCHQGVRRVVAFRHPDGRELPAGDGDYRPPVGPNAAGVQSVWLADGRAGERCAGWAAHRRGVVSA